MSCSNSNGIELDRFASNRILRMLEAAGESVWLRDLTTDEVSITPGVWSALGYPRQTIPGELRDVLKYFHPDDVGGVLEDLDRYLAGELDVYRRPSRVRSANGQWRWLRFSGGTIAVDEAGKPLVVGGLISDITESIERQQHRELAERKLLDLSAREADVLKGLTSGMTSKQIARALDLSPRTVEFYRGRLMHKLQVTSLPELVHLCVIGGWMSPIRHDSDRVPNRDVGTPDQNEPLQRRKRSHARPPDSLQ